MKRFFDFSVSLILLILLSPILVPIAIGLKLTGEGDIWYFQKRIGYQNRDFLIWKFATMLRDSPNMLTGSLTVRNDPRVTPLGRFLRSSKINEIPQLINVLQGNMSIVGPRPQMEIDFKAYPSYVQERIYSVKPGITGIGSIVFRDEEKMISEAAKSPRDFYDSIIAPYKGELELWYQKHQSFFLDIKLIIITLLVVFFPGIKITSHFRNLPPAPVEIRAYV